MLLFVCLCHGVDLYRVKGQATSSLLFPSAVRPIVLAVLECWVTGHNWQCPHVKHKLASSDVTTNKASRFSTVDRRQNFFKKRFVPSLAN
ncbi:hypothetical protein PoB_006087400 [Plakobranchus ocellatus]|uniref:Secreted protein n=1 Tax=Plakobranchus ocellatus TaxID=259542 RepID=A0AAV4CR56_9GAST|nr:hypothetical protein PoB_006087400 [Plakobranchus ocellatus]